MIDMDRDGSKDLELAVTNEMNYMLLNTNMNENEFLDYVQESLKPVKRFFSNYECAIMEVKTKFDVLNTQFSLKYDDNPIESIESRVKTYDSIMRKVARKKIRPTLKSIAENIDDIAGVRVICSFIDDIYVLADTFLQQDDITLLERVDYIKQPKDSGYRSLHLIVSVPIFLENGKRNVKVEVQFRTIAMDFWASLEHKMRYKKDLPEDLSAKLEKELSDTARKSAELDYRMQTIRNMLVGRN